MASAYVEPILQALNAISAELDDKAKSKAAAGQAAVSLMQYAQSVGMNLPPECIEMEKVLADSQRKVGTHGEK